MFGATNGAKTITQGQAGKNGTPLLDARDGRSSSQYALDSDGRCDTVRLGLGRSRLEPWSNSKASRHAAYLIQGKSRARECDVRKSHVMMLRGGAAEECVAETGWEGLGLFWWDGEGGEGAVVHRVAAY